MDSGARFEVLSDSGTLGFAGFGGTCNRRFFVPVPAFTFFAD
jgi:hypothetical protein